MSTAVALLPSRSETPAAAQALEALVRRRRAMPGFLPDPVPREIVDQALRIAAEAPSGYNFQPWRFLVLTSAERREKLRSAAFGQAKISQAPVVIVATADRREWREEAGAILRTQAARTGRDAADGEKLAGRLSGALAFVDSLPPEVWLTRQVMIAFTYLMLAFEAQGWETAPMEGFDPAAVRSALDLPESTEVVALLAVGRGADAAVLHPGRLPVERIARDESPDRPWITSGEEEGNPAHPPGVVS